MLNVYYCVCVWAFYISDEYCRMKSRNSLVWYIVTILICLFIIFFVGRSVDAEGKTSLIVTSDGIHHFRKGMDVAWWVRLTYKIDFAKYREIYTDLQEFSTITRGVKDVILQNIDTRISKLWVSDYNSYIQSLSDGEYVVVEIGGVFDVEQAKEIIWKTVELEFKTQYVGDGTETRTWRQILAEELLKQAVVSPELIAQFAENKQGDNIYYQNYANTALENLPKLYQDNLDTLLTLQPGTVSSVLLEWVYTEIPAIEWFTDAPSSLDWWAVVKFNGTSTTTGTNASGAITQDTVYSFEDIFIDYIPTWVTATDPQTNSILNGAFFKYASVGQSQTGQPVATITFDDTGKEIFCNLTEKIVGQPLAIFVWGELTTSPVIREKICGGTAQIDGGFTPTSAKELVDDLNEWAFPAPLILAHEEKVSASLWDKALHWAMIAGAVWLWVIFLYMMFMYGVRQGTIAVLTLVAFLIVLFALIKLLWYALSLSGIAAILLSIGMGVDANVLIFERVKEELQLKKWIHQSIIDGCEKSWSAIRDGNATTFMIAILLFFMGTNVFKGFGTMMMVNIILTLMVIVPLTQQLLLVFFQEEK